MKISSRLFGRLLGPLLLALLIALSSKEARAIGPVDIELGAKVGGATNPVNGSQVNPLGFGLGGRAGVSIFGLYGGLNLLYYFGTSSNSAIGSFSGNALQFGGELGYGFKLSILTIRPQVGLGNITFQYSGQALGFTGNSSSGSFYLEPGLTALLTFGIIYVGADLNALVITNGPTNSVNGGTTTDTAFTAHGQVGVVF